MPGVVGIQGRKAGGSCDLDLGVGKACRQRTKSSMGDSSEGQGRGLVYEGCCSKEPQPGLLETTEIYSLTELEAKV